MCVDVRQAAHQSGHGSKVERFEGHQLSEDVDGVVVLSVHSVFLKLLHIVPVLQRQTDLQPQELYFIHFISSRASFNVRSTL